MLQGKLCDFKNLQTHFFSQNPSYTNKYVMNLFRFIHVVKGHSKKCNIGYVTIWYITMWHDEKR